jgi:mono/diheme cytochrome c family protein
MVSVRLGLPLTFILGWHSSATAQDTVDYTRDVKPILSQNCVSCHGFKMQKGKLRLDAAALMLKGGNSGAAIVPGNASQSPLIHSLKGTNDFTAMPFKKQPLNDKQISVLVAWVNQGAKAPSDEVADDGTGRNHWAFKPPQPPNVPEVKDAAWPRNPIDNFILARLEREGIRPSTQADPITLIRRVYLDLLGLPPSLKDAEAFLADEKPDAYERLVDQLLASPHYGERWGRHWLDQARYADTHGFSIDGNREIWNYRDWVINALNADMPFNQFAIEQMAGDMLPKATVQQKVATGFHRNTQINQEGGIDVEQFRIEAVADRVNTTGSVFLGLTIGCARCHDHKFDPLTQREYYQLFAFLNNQSEPSLGIASPATVAKKETLAAKQIQFEDELDVAIKDYLEKKGPGESANLKADIAGILRLTPDQRTEMQKKSLATYFGKLDTGLKKSFDTLAALKKSEPKFATTLVLQEMSKPRVTYVHLGGDFTRKGDTVSPGVPAVLHSLNKSGPVNRLDLARWLVDPRNPLVGRVTVNRIWLQYFGRGLVETDDDFGTQGLQPSHAELLDWLATQFAGSASAPGHWSFKAMHRLIVTSATYRQSSKIRTDLAETDPDNRFLARQTRLRLDAEIVRDNALAASGLLSRKLGGPSVFPPQPDGIYQFTQVVSAWQTSIGDDRFRRGIYTFFKRSAPYPALSVFDAPDGTSACTRRIRSNTPLQALTLLNDQAFWEIARGLAQRVIAEGPAGDDERLNFAFRLCLARTPTAAEARRLVQFLNMQRDEFKAAPAAARAFLGGEAPKGKNQRPQSLPPEADMPEHAAWMAVTRVLLNLDEFINRE